MTPTNLISRALLLVLLCAMASAAVVNDRDALLAVRAAAINWETVSQPGWDVRGWEPSEPDVCQWSGVKCEDGHVVHLDFPLSYGTNDPIYNMEALEALAALRHLRSLRIGCGSVIDGQLPDSWAALERLELLSIYANVGGTLPGTAWAAPGAFPALVDLRIAGNLTGTLPAPWGAQHAFPQLTHLDLFVNTLEGTLPVAWARGFAQLEVLRLGLNPGLVGPLPPAWTAGSGFRRLRELELAETGLSGQLPHVMRLPSLQYLNLDMCHFRGTIPAAWDGMMPLLQTFSLHGNQLSGTIPAWVFRLHHLLFVHLGSNRLTGLPPPPPGCAPPLPPTLLDLWLDGNRLSGPLPWQQHEGEGCSAGEQGPVASGLLHLSLEGNQFTGSLPVSWHRVLPGLRSMDLSNNSLSGTLVPGWLGRFPQLRAIRLAGNHLTGTVPADYTQWAANHSQSEHKTLDLSGNQLTLEQLSAPEAQPDPASGAGSRPGAAAPEATASGVAAGGGWRRAGIGWGLAAGVVMAVLVAGFAATRRGFPRNRAAVGPDARWLPGGLSHRDTLTLELERLLQADSAQAGGPAHVQALHPGPRSLTARQLPPASDAAPLGGHTQLGLLAAGAADATPRRRIGSLRELSASEACSSTLALLMPGGGTGGEPAPMQSAASHAALGSGLQRLQLSDLQFCRDSLGRLEVLGSGGMGVVLEALLHGVQPVAVKMARQAKGATAEEAMSEAQMLQQCSHARVVQLLGVCWEQGLVLLVMELMERGSLLSCLHLPEMRWHARGRGVLLDVALGLAYLHSCSVLHSDIKPANVLLGAEWEAKLADCGSARRLRSSLITAGPGTVQFAAPEQLLGQRVSAASDIYALGLLFLTVIQGEQPRGRGQHCDIRDLDCPPDVADLILACLEIDPARRPSAKQVAQQLRRHCGPGIGPDLEGGVAPEAAAPGSLKDV